MHIFQLKLNCFATFRVLSDDDIPKGERTTSRSVWRAFLRKIGVSVTIAEGCSNMISKNKTFEIK